MVAVRSLHCPNCGGPVEIRGFAHSLNVVCPQCLTVLDASNPLLTILQRSHQKQRVQPLIPLGSRGKFNGVPYQSIGFQVRSVGDVSWSEYLLFNPYQGFRYLSEYQGHWNFIRVLADLPDVTGSDARAMVRYGGAAYKHFDHSVANTTYVLGEFPWQVRVGDSVTVDDYVSPPRMLSSEATGGEVTWSLGEYYTGAQIWQAFQLPGQPAPAQGIFANQPSPYLGKTASAWMMWLWLMVALVALVFLFTVGAGRHEVFRQHYTFTPGTASEASFVTPEFELTGRASNLEVALNTDLHSDWAYFNFALINEDTGQARDFGREVSYYSDEGSPRDRVILAHVPSGKYYLRVEPEKQAGSSPLAYDLVVRRDVPSYGWFWLAAVLLTIPPIFTTIRRGSFETRRWRESDYAPASSGE